MLLEKQKYHDFTKTPHIPHLWARNPHGYWAEHSDLFSLKGHLEVT